MTVKVMITKVLLRQTGTYKAQYTTHKVINGFKRTAKSMNDGLPLIVEVVCYILYLLYQ